MRLRLVFLFASIVALAGCAYRTPEVHVPTALRDGHDATVVVEVRGADGDEGERAVRADVERWLGGIGGVVHARVAIEGTNQYALHALRQDGLAVFGLWPVAFGMTYESETIDVDVEIEIAGRTVRGHGEAEKHGSVYAHARRRALAAAVDRALAGAS